MEELATEDLDALLAYNILRTNAGLQPFIDRGLRDLNLTGAQLNTLLVLRDAGPEGIALGEIGRQLVVTKANVTGLIDRLEREELVQRDGHADRRITLAKLTPKGRDLLDAVLPRHRRLLEDLLDGLDLSEKQQLIALLTRIRRGLREKQRGGIG